MSLLRRARGVSFGLVLTVLATLVVGPTPAVALEGGDQTIVGRVLGDGLPLPGAAVTVCVADDCLVPAITDAAGEYTLELVPREIQLTFRVSAPDFLPHSSGLTLGGPVGPAMTMMDIYLQRGAVRGVVRDDAGSPVAGVFVNIGPVSSCSPYGCMSVGSAISGADGSFLIGASLATGTYRLSTSSVYPSGPFRGPDVDVSVVVGSTITQDLAVVRAGTVEGTVTDDAGAPVAGASISFQGTMSLPGATTTTNASGYFSKAGLAPGLRTVAITPPASATQLAPATRSVEVVPGAVAALDVVLVRGASLEIVVKTAEGAYDDSVYLSAGACPGSGPASVFCPGVRFAMKTAPGRFRVNGLAPGAWTAAIVRGPGFTIAGEAPFVAASGDEIVCEFIGNAGTCATSTTDDADGVDAAVEDGAPNGGDGNSDGTPDAEQLHVTSLPAQVDGAPYVTIEAPAGTQLAAVESVDPSTLPPAPAGSELPVGLLHFEVRDVEPGASLEVRVHLPAGTGATTYLKHDGTAWSDFSAYASFAGDVVTLTLTDGGPGDVDGEANGVIVDPGGPGVSPFGGFLAPLGGSDELNLVNAGSTVPVKFSLGGDVGLDVLAAGSPTSRSVDCDTGAPIIAVPSTSTTATRGLRYDELSQQYSYLWKTQPEWSSTCRELTLHFADGSSYQVVFALR